MLTSILIYNEFKNNEVIIPDTAIRLRVIPNSNSSLDQSMKNKVKKYLENLLLIMRYLLLMRILLKLVKM